MKNYCGNFSSSEIQTVDLQSGSQRWYPLEHATRTMNTSLFTFYFFTMLNTMNYYYKNCSRLALPLECILSLFVTCHIFLLIINVLALSQTDLQQFQSSVLRWWTSHLIHFVKRVRAHVLTNQINCRWLDILLSLLNFGD